LAAVDRDRELIFTYAPCMDRATCTILHARAWSISFSLPVLSGPWG